MEKLPKEENDFFMYIQKLNEMYEEKPQKVSKAVRETLANLGGIEKTTIYGDLDIDKFALCILIIFIAIIGILNFSNFPIYLFGIAFFLAGHFIGLYVDGFGLIFLFSHSVTGMVVMEGALIGEILTSPIMSDLSTNLIAYLGINLALFVIATLIVILHNLSHSFRNKSHIILMPMAMYAIAFTMSAILPKIITFIN